MKLIYLDKHKTFFFKCKFTEIDIPKNAGFNYDKKNNIWFTKDKFKARVLQKYASPELRKRFDDFITSYVKKLEYSYSHNSDIVIPKPDNGFEFYGYQKAGIEFLYDRKYALLADDMGLGKSPQTIGAINLMKDFKKIVILCPNSVKYNWEKEWKTWSVHQDKDIRVYNSSNIEDKGDVIIINYEVMNNNTNPSSPKFRDPSKGKYNSSLVFLNIIKEWKDIDVLVCDESHRLKNWSANTTRNTYKVKKYAKRIWFLTGTPMLSTPEDLWTTIKFFGYNKEFEGDKKEFTKKYCGAYYHQRFNQIMYDIDNVPKETLQELQLKLRKHFMMRRLKKNVLKELPDKVRSMVPIEVSRTFIKKYKHIDKIFSDISTLNTDPSKSIIAGIKPKQVQELATFRKDVGLAKIRSVVDFTKELLEQDKKVVLYAHHTEVIETYIKKFKKYNPVAIYGKTPDKERQIAVDSFQNDNDTKIFIGNFKAASEGITLTASHIMVMAEFDWVPALMKQAEDRIYRISQDHLCTIYYLVADNTSDGYVLSTIIDKIKRIEQVMEKETLK